MRESYLATLSVLSLAALELCGCSPAPPAGEGGVTTQMSSGSTADSDPDPDPSSDAETSTTSTDEGCFFEHCLDFGSGEEWDCDPYLQDCPEGSKCLPRIHSSPKIDFGGYVCGLVLGDLGAGEPCTAQVSGEVRVDDCGPGGVCQNLREAGDEFVGTCAPHCMGSADDPQCPAGHSCAEEFFAGPIYCARDCDPLAQDCQESSSCRWSGERFECMLDLEQLPSESDCAHLNDCASGNICVSAEVLTCETATCCASFCDLEQGDEACQLIDPSYVCVGFFEDDAVPPGLPTLGLCVLP